MTNKLPQVTATEVIKALEHAGFSLARQGKRVTVPYREDYPSQGFAAYLDGCRLNCGRVQDVAKVKEIDLFAKKWNFWSAKGLMRK